MAASIPTIGVKEIVENAKGKALLMCSRIGFQLTFWPDKKNEE